jgi:hypothetical protein
LLVVLADFELNFNSQKLTKKIQRKIKFKRNLLARLSRSYHVGTHIQFCIVLTGVFSSSNSIPAKRGHSS